MSDEDDPFETFDEAVGDREGNPFESLGGPDDEGGSDDESESDDADGDDPDREERLGGPAENDEATSSTADGAESETAFTVDASEGVDAGGTGGDPFGTVDQREGDPFDAFEEMDVGDLDADHVWESLTEAENRGSVAERDGRTYAEVSKHSFCERCEHFSAPPDVGCHNEGTEILEFLDLETVRVVDCPVVAERRELQQE